MWLKLSKAAESDIRMSWGNDKGPYDPYHIGPATLDAASTAVREALAQLVKISGRGEPRAEAIALRALAAAGAELYFALFDGSPHPNAAVVKKALETAHSKNRKLCITGHPQVHVPWGLVFDGDPATIPSDSNNPLDYGNFWGLKFCLSCTLSGYAQDESKLIRAGGKSTLLSLYNQTEAEKAYGNLSEDLQIVYDKLMARPVGVARDLTECLQRIEEAVSNDTVLNVFTHQTAGELGLGDAGTINVLKFGMLLDKLAKQSGVSPSYSLVMINACDSATGKADYSFTCATNRPGICGMIGTEAVVPRDFAAKFSIRFLDLLLHNQKSVGDTMDLLRQDITLWPLSLVYGCYAQPEYRIT